MSLEDDELFFTYDQSRWYRLSSSRNSKDVERGGIGEGPDIRKFLHPRSDAG